jgi:hypothetical protein
LVVSTDSKNISKGTSASASHWGIPKKKIKRSPGSGIPVAVKIIINVASIGCIHKYSTVGIYKGTSASASHWRISKNKKKNGRYRLCNYPEGILK